MTRGEETSLQTSSGTYRSFAQGQLHSRKVTDRAPDLPNEAFISDAEAALVEDEVDSLHLLDLDLPCR